MGGSLLLLSITKSHAGHQSAARIDADEVRTEAADLCRYSLARTAADCVHRHHGGNANDDAKHRECAAKAMRTQYA
jgi:hypothetical protein